MISWGDWACSKNTVPRYFAALISVLRGVVTITALMVPPSTIINAVTCAMSVSFPPSITRPPRIPPAASTNPPSVAMSGRVDDFFALASLLLAIGLSFLLGPGAARHSGCYRRRTRGLQLMILLERTARGQDGTPELNHFFHN